MSRYKKKSKSFFKALLVLSLSVIGLSLIIFRVQQVVPEERSEAVTNNALSVRVTKSYLVPGESYSLFAVEDKMVNKFYSGYLEVLTTTCDIYGKNCVINQGPWKDFDGTQIYITGQYRVTVPEKNRGGVFKAKFRPLPNPNDFGWSNEIQINISSTYGLINSKEYWTFWYDKKKFVGRNNVYGENFVTMIGYENNNFQTELCPGVFVNPMTVTKNNVYGYWNPAVPWYNALWNSGDYNLDKVIGRFDIRFKRDMRFYLVNWMKKTGWQDTWLTAYAFRTYQYLTNPQLSQLQTQALIYGSQNPSIPQYFLTPVWIG